MTENYLDILADTIRNNWDKPALTDFYLTEDGKAQDTSRGNHYTYGEMYAEIVRVADFLTNLGLQKGDHIAICDANSAHWVIAYLAIAKMQGVSVTVMHSLMEEDIARLVDFSDAKALFVDGELWEELKDQSMPQIKSVIAIDDWGVLQGKKISISNLQSPISNQDCQFPHPEPDNLAMICFTSGTTGGAKGVSLSYQNMDKSVDDAIEIFSYSDSGRVLSLFPFGHMLGIHFELLFQLCFGKTVFLFRDVRTIDNLFYAYKIVRPYAITTPPAMVKSIVDKYQCEFIKILRECAYILIGGALIPKELMRLFSKYHLKYAIGYGTTECGPFISKPVFSEKMSESVGKFFNPAHCRIALNGEILVKGENVMLGYYKDPEATAAKIDAEGWLHTGDKGHLDEDGYLYVEGRLEQDIIVLPNGENIRPDNIERLIDALPEVKESIVLARDGKLVAIVVSQITNADLKLNILHQINPLLPLYSQLDEVEISNVPLVRTSKQTLKRYLYK